MNGLSFAALPDPWWPYVFILLAGWLPTDIWRFLGVVFAGRIREDSQLVELVRAIATALVAAVIARLVLYPTGSLALIPDIARIGAMAGGFAAYLGLGRSVVLGVATSQIILMAGATLL